MPATRDANLRGGDLAEGLGLELLRPFAFIAPVPRPEDVGADAVATLIRQEGRRLFAEDSFLVQSKAASVRSLGFKEEHVNWFRSLTMPYYLLSVDLATTTCELRTTIRVTGHPNFGSLKTITMYLDSTDFKITCDDMHVWLGPPILRWQAADAAMPTFQENAYAILKAWLCYDMRCIAVRSLGMSYSIAWETNCIPEPDGSYTILHRPGELQNVLEGISPYIQRLAALVFPLNNNAHDLLVGLTLVSEFMRRQGVDPDPNRILNVFGKLLMKLGGTGTQAGQSVPIPPP